MGRFVISRSAVRIRPSAPNIQGLSFTARPFFFAVRDFRRTSPQRPKTGRPRACRSGGHLPCPISSVGYLVVRPRHTTRNAREKLGRGPAGGASPPAVSGLSCVALWNRTKGTCPRRRHHTARAFTAPSDSPILGSPFNANPALQYPLRLRALRRQPRAFHLVVDDVSAAGTAARVVERGWVDLGDDRRK